MITRKDLIGQLKNMKCTDAEEKFRRSMIELLETQERCFYRDCFPSHFTGSALVLNEDRTQILLTHHKFLNQWLQFGGHCDGEEDIFKTALREAQEESGIENLQPLSEMPLDIDIHPIPENPKKNESSHFHYDVRYAFVAPADETFQVSDESHALQWFSLEKLPSLDAGITRLISKVFHFVPS